MAKQLSILVYGKQLLTNLPAIDDRIICGGRMTFKFFYGLCYIPVASAGEIIEKILCTDYIEQISLSGVILTEPSIKSVVFQQFKSMQSNCSLKNFNVNTVEERNSNTNTLLHWATICGDVDIVKFLLQSGAQEVENCDQNTAREYANLFGRKEMKDIFTQWDKIKKATSYKRTSFCYAFNKMIEQDKNLPHIPKEIVEMIGRNIKPVFNTPKPPA